MKQIDYEILPYCVMNYLISALLTAALWFFATSGGVISYIAAILGFPGFLFFIVFRGTLGAYSFLKEYPVYYFAVNFIIYSLVIGLIQRWMWKKKSQKLV
jgi:hypothetical protein